MNEENVKLLIRLAARLDNLVKAAGGRCEDGVVFGEEEEELLDLSPLMKDDSMVKAVLTRMNETAWNQELAIESRRGVSQEADNAVIENALRREIQSLKRDLDKRYVAYEGLVGEYNQLETFRIRVEKEISGLRILVEEQKSEIEELSLEREAARDLGRSVGELKEEKARLTRVLENEKSQYRVLESELKEREWDLATVRRELGVLSQRLQESEKTLERVRGDYEKVKRELEETGLERDSLAETNHALKASEELTREEMAELENRYNLMRERLEKLGERGKFDPWGPDPFDVLKEQLGNVTQDRNRFESDLHRAQAQAAALLSRVKELEGELSDTHSLENAQLQKDHIMLKLQYNHLRNQPAPPSIASDDAKNDLHRQIRQAQIDRSKRITDQAKTKCCLQQLCDATWLCPTAR